MATESVCSTFCQSTRYTILQVARHRLEESVEASLCRCPIVHFMLARSALVLPQCAALCFRLHQTLAHVWACTLQLAGVCACRHCLGRCSMAFSAPRSPLCAFCITVQRCYSCAHTTLALQSLFSCGIAFRAADFLKYHSTPFVSPNALLTAAYSLSPLCQTVGSAVAP